MNKYWHHSKVFCKTSKICLKYVVIASAVSLFCLILGAFISSPKIPGWCYICISIITTEIMWKNFSNNISIKKSNYSHAIREKSTRVHLRFIAYVLF